MNPETLNIRFHVCGNYATETMPFYFLLFREICHLIWEPERR